MKIIRGYFSAKRCFYFATNTKKILSSSTSQRRNIKLSVFFLLFFSNVLSYEVFGQNLEQVVLQIENETFTDQAFFLFTDNGQIGSDPLDGHKLPSLSSSFGEVYSQDTSGNNYSINTLPNKLQEVLQLPVYIRSTVSDTFKVSVTKFENIQPNWTLSLVNLSTNDTLSLSDAVSVDVIHSGDFQSGVLTVQHFLLLINPGIVTQKGSITGTSGKDGWHFFGSPFSNVSYAQLLDSVWTQGATGADNPSGLPNIFTWSESNQTFEAVTDLSVIPGVGSGFVTFTYEDDNPLKHGLDGGWPKSINTSGIAGFGTIQIPVSYTSGANTSLNGFNLAANPYPFSIDWNAASGWTKSNMQDAIWIWDSNANSGNGDYLEHVSGVGAAINVIAPYQAFWVRAIDTTPGLSVDESVKVSGGTLLKKHDTIPVLTLKVRSKEFDFEDTHYLSFRERGDVGMDDYDMTKVSPVSTDYLNVYSLFGKEELAINNLPGDFTRLEIPVQLDHTLSGNFTFSVERFHLSPEEVDIRLFDEKRQRLVEVDTFNTYTFHSDSGVYNFTLILESTVSTSDEEKPEIPGSPQLFQNYPNPFNPVTTISYQISRQTRVHLEVFDMMGRKVANLVDNELKQPGHYSAYFDASELASGLYIYTMRAGQTTLTKKLTLIK